MAPTKVEQEAIRANARDFLAKFGIKGLSIAYGRDGKIAFEQGYGFADSNGKEPVTPKHLFRIASISKPITATAVMLCIERGLLNLEDKVFGPQSILGNDFGVRLPENVIALTVDHLLTNTSGWLSHWSNGKSHGDDPMFRNLEMNHQELITWALKNQQQMYPPGTQSTYSNFGYCILGRVLEKVTKLPYEKFVSQQVLSRCGIQDMCIGGNALKDRHPHEVIYEGKTPGYYHDGKPVTPYSMNVARMDSHGGWIATARDLVLFASQLQKTSSQNGVLTDNSLRAMTTPGTLNPGYARGWCVNRAPSWWHGGGLSGTISIMVHSYKRICWAALLNSDTPEAAPALDQLMWKMGGEVSSWKLL